MKLLKNLIIIAISALCLSSFADEVSEESPSVDQSVFDASGKVVSPENQIDDSEISQEQSTQGKANKPDPKPVLPPKGMVPKSLVKMGLGDYYSAYAFLLDKSQRTLSIWKNTPKGPVFVEAHAADMGRVDGDKQILGDKKTPEGIYFFQSTHRENALDFNEYGSQAYTMNYPNLFDRREKKTGSGIWLHAIPETKTLYRGSRGCVVVRNDVIQSLEKYISYKKTPIIVQKTIEYVAASELSSQQTALLNWLEDWRKSWEAMELNSYMNFYAPDFYSAKMNHDGWREFKLSLNNKYEYIRVQIAKPSVFIHENEAIIRFLQGYNSDKNSDFGEKILHLKKQENGEFKIIAEKWSALSNKLLALLSDNKDSLIQKEL